MSSLTVAERAIGAVVGGIIADAAAECDFMPVRQTMSG